ncbi:hypothetical protein Dimus_037304, partial [Dionaea muscipula]
DAIVVGGLHEVSSLASFVLGVGILGCAPEMGKGARVAGVFIGASPPVLLPVPASAADSGGLRKKMNEGDDGDVGADEVPGSASPVSSNSSSLPAMTDDLEQQPTALESSLSPTGVAKADGRMVREEEVDTAGAAVRPQSADGLRQPPRPSVEPLPVRVEEGFGIDDMGGAPVGSVPAVT